MASGRIRRIVEAIIMKLPSICFTIGVLLFANTFQAQEPLQPGGKVQQLRAEIQKTEAELQEVVARLQRLKEALAKLEASPQSISPSALRFPIATERAMMGEAIRGLPQRGNGSTYRGKWGPDQFAPERTPRK